MRLIAGLTLVVPWVAGAALGPVRWTHPSGAPVSVAVIQADIPQDEKWQDAYEDKILQRYRKMTESALGTKLIVWPEAALPEPANNMLALHRGGRSRDPGQRFLAGDGRDPRLG